MKKQFNLLMILAVITTILFSTLSISASVMPTYKDKGGYWGNDYYKVRASTYWEYETGIYNSVGVHQTLQKPTNTLFNNYWIAFNSVQVQNSYYIAQYFLPCNFNGPSGQTTCGPVIVVPMSSPGPR